MNTDWFYDAKWGVFVHYPAGPREEWNAQVDAFDVDGLVEELVSTGAGYFFITLTHGHGLFCAPSAVYDELLEVDARASRCSRRDLVADLSKPLESQGIRLMLYVPATAPTNDPYAVKKLRWIDGQTLGWGIEGNAVRQGRRPIEFMRKWESLLRDFSERWRKSVHGWWLDGCYWPEHIYRHDAEPNFKSLAEALKAGNPDALVAFNGGLETPIIVHSEYEDYTAGEVGHLLPLGTRSLNGLLNPIARFIDGAQYHVLTHLGTHWGQRPPRFPVELVIGYTKYVTQHGGVVTWDAGIDKEGHLQPDHLQQLTALGKALR
jgi:hypothetical protein